MSAARFMSFWTGFCSLSLEIAWVRLYGYANESTPQAFGYVLAVYLLGIAFGAQLGKSLCQRLSRGGIERAAVLVLAVSAALAVLLPWVYRESVEWALQDQAAFVGVFFTAASFAVMFPITHHLGTVEVDVGSVSSKGRSFSRVYLLNVLGSALGPLIVGYVLLEHWSITQVFAILGAVAWIVALIAAFQLGLLRHRGLAVWLAVLAACPAVAVWQSAHDPVNYVRTFAVFSEQRWHSSLENRHGVISLSSDVAAEGAPPDHSVYGGNVYDGKTNTDLQRNSNGLHRPLVAHMLQPEAKHALVLGLSIGSWLAVIEGFPGLEKIDVVEINPGYLEMARRFPVQRRALEDSRVDVNIDDARRWLQYRPTARYDLIVMNTTWHWRSNSTLLLSQEMMRLLQRHLTSQGVLIFNATGSLDAFYTASTVFSHVRRYENFIYAANWDAFANVAEQSSWDLLKNVTIDGRAALGERSSQLAAFSAKPFVRLEDDITELGRMPELITDDNMLVEYRRGRRQ